MIIGFSGRIGAGKTTIADMIVRRFGFRKRSFADPLRKAVREVFGLTERDFLRENKETVIPFWSKSPRQIMQQVGTDLFRNGFDSDIWVKSTMRYIDSKPDSDFVLDDLRFVNEAQAVLDRGGVVVRIERPFADDEKAVIHTHSSENSMFDWAGYFSVVRNDGAKADLEARAIELVANLRSGHGVTV